MDMEKHFCSGGTLSRGHKSDFYNKRFVSWDDTLKRVDTDLLALFEVGKLKLEVQRDRVIDRILLSYSKDTNVAGYRHSTAPKSITLGKIALRSGSVGKAYRGTTKFSVSVRILTTSVWYLHRLLNTCTRCYGTPL